MRNKVGRQKCDMWISNNRVLIGGGVKRPHARNPNFETEETRLLISLWGDPKVQKTLITTHKKHPVISKLADAMRERGYHRSTEEINTRIKNLKCFYNRIKKDMEMGLISEPTWKHYGAMDEILTRPIFGNRVQQPHLQNAQKSSDDDDSKDLRPEDLLSVEEDMDDESDMDDSIIPKEEPIDIDDMDDIAGDDDPIDDNEIHDVNDIFPKLSAYLQLGSNSALKGSAPSDVSNSNGETMPILDIKTSPPSSPLPEPESTSNEDNTEKKETIQIITTKATAVSIAPSSIVSLASTSNNTATLTANKISLVPTNMLMKSVTTTATSSQPTFGFKSSPIFKASGSGATLTTASNGVGMKVLLVNTLSKPNGLTTPNTVSVTTKPIISTPITTRSLVNIQPKPSIITANTPHSVVQNTYQTRSATAANAQATQIRPTLLSSNKYLCSGASANNDANVKRNISFKTKPPPGFRTMFNQMVQLQQKQLEVSKERLEIERERLEFERKTGDKILDALTALLQSRSQTKEVDSDKEEATRAKETSDKDTK